jgi:PTS system nitrogen regulatory IIA component
VTGAVRICDLLSPDAVRIPLKGADRQSVIEELVAAAAATGKVSDPPAALDAVMKREALSGTGLDHGVAVPHARTPTVSELVCALGVSPAGVQFLAPDGLPSRLFFLFLSPERSAGSAIQLLATIAWLSSDRALRSELVAAGSADEAIRLIREKEDRSAV